MQKTRKERNEYTHYHIQKIINQLGRYTLFELEILVKGIAEKISELSASNENSQNSQEIAILMQGRNFIVRRYNSLVWEIEDQESWFDDDLDNYSEHGQF